MDSDAAGSADRSRNWVEPFVGARANIDLGEDFVLQVRGDVGGFGLGSDFAWQLAAVIGWQFEMFDMDAALFVGYRALAQDYEEGSFEWDVIAHGPILGLGFTF